MQDVIVEKKDKSVTNHRPRWFPSDIWKVDDALIEETFFSRYSPSRGTAPALELPSYATKLQDPMRFALPTEEEIRQMVSGEHPSSGGTEITEEELLSKFFDIKKGKGGLREKISEVVRRRCTFELDKHLDKTWLRWKR